MVGEDVGVLVEDGALEDGAPVDDDLEGAGGGEKAVRKW